MRILFTLLTFLLVSTPSFGHGLDQAAAHRGAAMTSDAGSGSMSESMSGPAVAASRMPGVPGHRQHGSGDGGSLHCSVSTACTPLFNLTGDEVQPRSCRGTASWAVAPENLRAGQVLKRDPPVPRA